MTHPFPTRRSSALLDRGDERAARPLQPVDLGIGVEDGHAFALEHHCSGRFPHADRSGEPEDERPAEPRAGALPSPHAISSARSSSRSEEHTYELQSLMRISYAVFCLKKKKQ